MDYLNAIVLSVVEGITEFLPVSSTGHLILAADLLGIQQTNFVKSFEIAIQAGAILAVVSMYFKTLAGNRTVCSRLAVAFIPSAVLGFVFYTFIKEFLLGNTAITLAALFLGGITLIMLEYIYREKENNIEKIENMGLWQAFGIGMFQSISMIPGVSRAGATILGGLFLSLKRKTAVEFSFLLAIPTMLAATALDLLENGFQFNSKEYTLFAIGLIGAFFTARITVAYFLRFIEHHTFIPFGIYRIALSLVFWAFVVL